jgi:hypothetical protein
VADRLPGFGSIRRSKWRNERAVDGVAKLLRDTDRYGPIEAAVVCLARTTAASLDRLEHDELRSEHVIGTVARVHLQALSVLRPSMMPTGDAFDRMLDELSTAVRDPTAP